MNAVLKYHRTIEHEGRKKICTICGKSVAKMKDHIQRAHTVESNYPCDICDYRGKTKDMLRQHKKNHIDPADRPFRCEVCGKGFLFGNKLRIHLRTHVNIKSFV